jgi:hypothetical protein
VLAHPRLVALQPLVMGAWLTIKDPKLRVLEAMPAQFLAVTIDLDP